MNKLRLALARWIAPAGTIYIPSKEYVESSIKMNRLQTENDSLKSEAQGLRKPMSRMYLTMRQLGSYAPDFSPLEKQSDDFKQALAQLCHNLSQSTHWNYLVNHLKQDQVNLYLFDEERKPQDFVRGSINGIYVVDEQVRLLGNGFVSKPEPQEEK